MAVDARTLTLQRPRSLEAALAMLAKEPTLTPVAGCTDLLVGLHFGAVDKRQFIDLWSLDELRGITAAKMLRIGALATYTDIIASPVVRKRLPMLIAAAREVGGAQIQNRGTLGGNIANASPAGDTLPVLAVAGAQVVLRSAGGERRVPFSEYYTGYRTSVRQPDELIIAVEIPPVAGRQWWRKVGTRRAQAISKIMMAGVRGPAEAGRHMGTVRIALGSVAPTVVLATRTSDVLTNGGTLGEAQAVLRGEIAPIDDVRSTGEYRHRVAENLLAQFWKETNG